MKNKTRRTPPAKVLIPMTATVPAETKRRLQELARSDHRNLSQTVRLALEEYLERRSTAAA